ncbi:MAG: hypothetical protein QG633_490 [Patescibacteria group bacterium]|nr:hypothetical protein [Patescibacteria group bacterium]
MLPVLVLPAFFVRADGGGPGVTPQIENPLGATRDLSALILKVVDGIAQIGYYVVVLFVIYSGFKFVKARGNDKELADAKQTFLYTVIGAAILLGATLLANVISGTVEELKTPPPSTRVVDFNV